MSAKERLPREPSARVKRKAITVVEASDLLRRSLRQARRVCKRFREQGDAGLMHRLRGRPSNRRLSEPLRQQIVKRHQGMLCGLWPHAGLREAGGGRTAAQPRHAQPHPDGAGAAAAAGVPGFDPADGRFSSRLVRGPRAQVRADGVDRRCDPPHLCEFLPGGDHGGRVASGGPTGR